MELGSVLSTALPGTELFRSRDSGPGDARVAFPHSRSRCPEPMTPESPLWLKNCVGGAEVLTMVPSVKVSITTPPFVAALPKTLARIRSGIVKNCFTSVSPVDVCWILAEGGAPWKSLSLSQYFPLWAKPGADPG